MRLLILTLVALVLYAQPAQAGFVGAWLLAATGAATVKAAVGAIALRLVASVAISAVSLLQQKRKQKKQLDPGIRTTFTTSGGTDPQGSILGRFATAGHYLYRMSRGINRSNLTEVIELSDIPGVTLESVIVDGEPSELGPPDANGKRQVLSKQNSEGGFCTIRFYDGTQTEADQILVGHFANHPKWPWTEDHILTGIAYVVVSYSFNRKLFRSDKPNLQFVLGGIPLYDPRRDGSVGGSGPHRWTDKSTWEQTTNPVVMIYNILRGIELPTGEIWGGDAEFEDVPLWNWVPGMNVADIEPGSTRPQFQAGLEFRFEDEPSGVIEELLASGNAQIAELGGVWTIQVGAPAPAVAHITDADILVSEPSQRDPFPGLEATHNAITVSHTSPAALWRASSPETILNAEWEAADGQRRLFDLKLPAVFDGNQGRQVAENLIRDERRFINHGNTLVPEFFRLQPLFTVAWTSEHNDYLDKLFEITGASYDLRTLKIAVKLRERDPDDFTHNPALELPEPPLLAPPDEFGDAGVPGFGVAPHTDLDGAGGERRPGVRAVWDASIADTVDGLSFELRVVGQANLAWSRDLSDVSSGSLVVVPLLRDETYEMRARPIASNRDTLWTNWLSVTTPNVGIGDDDLSSDLDNRIQEARDEADAGRIDAAESKQLAADVQANLTALTTGFSGTIAGQLTALENDLRSEFGTYTSLISVGDFSNGSGDWSPADHTIVTTTPQGLPVGVTHAMRLDDQRANDGDYRVEAGMAGRVLRFTGWALTEDSPYNARIGVQTLQSDGVTSEVTVVNVRLSGEAGWGQFSVDVTLPDDVGQWRPFLRTSDFSMDPNQNVYFAQLAGRDITGTEGLATLLEGEYRKAIDQDSATTQALDTFRTSLTDPTGEIGAIWAEFNNNRYTRVETNQAVSLAITSASATLNARMDGIDTSVAQAVTTSNSYADQAILTLSSPGGAIAALSDQVNADITTLRGEVPGFTVTLDDLSKLHDRPGGTTAAAAVGQSAVIGVTDQGGTRSTNGSTSGDIVVEIPEPTALQFAGRRIKISALVYDHGAVNGMSLVYSTAGSGNSGEMTDPLSGAWQWVSFFYDVPVLTTTGPHYVGIWAGEVSGTGNSLRVAGMAIEIATEAADLPEIESLSGNIEELRGLDLTALEGTAFGTFLTQMEVSAGGESATIEQLNAARVNQEGFSEAFSGLTVTTSGGAIAGFKATSSTDPSGASSSLLELLGDAVVVGSMQGNRLTAKTITAELGLIDDAAVGTLQIGDNAVTIPVTQTRNTAIAGTGGWVNTVSEVYIDLPEAGYVTIQWNGSQGYVAQQEQAIGLRLRIDGNEEWSRITGDPPGSGGIELDWLSMAWSEQLSAGMHHIEVDWWGGNANLVLSTRTVIVNGAMR